MSRKMSSDRIDDYVIQRTGKNKLGRGASGDVFRGQHITSGTEVAVKEMKLADMTEEGEEYNRKYIENEVKVLRSVEHKNIIKLFHSAVVDSYLYLFLELCILGSMNDFLSKNQLTKRLCLTFMWDIAKAIR